LSSAQYLTEDENPMPASKPKSSPLQRIAFKSAAEFRKWLTKNYGQTDGIWMQIYKKDSGKTTITYAEALDEALCYGWIDGLKQKYDELSWIQKFTPRRTRSGWSKINTQHIARLTKEGRMKPSGLKEVEAAQKDGRWKAAYDSAKISTVPEDFLKELRKNPKAKAFFDTLNKSNLYAITYRLQTAKKPETRERRMKVILEMLAKGEKFH
jgi:uncharacterized protein YdeI (YjbR/CyaY-like superfamily)